MRSSSRNKLLFILLALAVVGFLLYRSSGLLHSGDFFANLLKAVRRADPALLALSTVAIYACYAIRALRWQVLQRNLGPSRFWQIYAMTLAGFAAVLALGRPGEPIRVLLLARKEKLPAADLFGIYLVERILDTASTLVIAALALLLIKSGVESKETAGKFVPAFQTAGALLAAGVLGAIASVLGRSGISIASVIQQGREAERTVPIVMRTHQARERNLKRALAAIARRKLAGAAPAFIRIEENL